MGILYVFAGAIAAILACGFLALYKALNCAGSTPATIDDVIAKGVIPLIQQTGTFASTVFSGLLAFVLGYYFGEKSKVEAESNQRRDH